MTTDPILNHFLALSTFEQVKFLKYGNHEAYAPLDDEAKIRFVKSILKSDLSSKTLASALKVLRELGYNDKFFYRKFLYHIDSSVSNAARKAINECSASWDNKTQETLKRFQEGSGAERMQKIEDFLCSGEKIDEEILVSLLSSEDPQTRQALVDGISPDHLLDEARLTRAVTAGAVWYVRAALVTILGNRKSKRLLDIIDFLVNDRNVEVRLALIEALCKTGGEKNRSYLEKLTEDPLVWVRKRAQKALSLLHD